MDDINTLMLDRGLKMTYPNLLWTVTSLIYLAMDSYWLP